MTAYDDTLKEARRIDTSQPNREEEAIPAPTIVQANHQPMERERANHPQGVSATESVREFVRENPGPAVLIAAGLAWLFVNREQARSRTLPVRIKDSAARLKDSTTEKLDQARESTSETLHHAREVTSDKLQQAKEATTESLQQAREATEARAQALRQAASEKAQMAQEKYRLVLQENPLALGAGALIAGLVLGLLLPSTRRENELLGETRDSLMDQAKAIVNEARTAAVSTLRANRDSVEEKLLETKQEVENAVRESLHQAGEAAKDQL